MTFTSYRTKDRIDWDQIYDGNVRRDRNLGPREKPDGLADYVSNAIERGTLS